ncbi:hypothetical protein EIP86_000158 [Pleurotus ostreatoroseus]|nr:hypothetical protein EIP86_000158 [Pleurotus ostreatoroseus]
MANTAPPAAHQLVYAAPDSDYHSGRDAHDAAMRALLASTWQVMDQVQRPPPTMNDILGAYRAKGDGDREMLLALLNAKTAEENRVAAITALHRTLLDLYNGPGVSPAESAPRVRTESQCAFPSPPSSSYHQSPLVDTQGPRPRRRKSSSPSAYSSEDSLSPQPRKRHRSRSPLSRDRRVRVSYEHAPSLESSFPPSPYSSASSQSSIGSPRSRESMTIGALLTPAHEKDIDMDDRRLSAERTVPRGASPRLARRDRENTLSHRA